VRIFAAALVVLVLLISASCGGSSHAATGGALTGNWQINLSQNYPLPPTQISISGFLSESSDGLTGSVQGPTEISSNGKQNCGGVGLVTGTISGQNVTFSLDPGGTIFNFTGVISSDSTSMSGSYQALAGACFTKPTTGTWTASLIPPLNGSFTGTFNSNYMAALTGSGTPVPVPVSGSFTQSPNAGTSSATLTGTVTAVGYPCFTTASLTGTISGQNIYLSLYGYNGLQIGTLGQVEQLGVPPIPAILTVTSTGFVVTGYTSSQGFYVDLGNPCPAVINSFGKAQTTDSGGFTLNVE